MTENLIAGSIAFDSNGPYTLNFAAAGSYQISSSTLSFQSDLTIDAVFGATVEIDSAMSGSGSTLTKTNLGTLDLTNSANSFQSAVVREGTLEAQTTGSLPGYASGAVSINAGATLAVAVNGNSSEWTATNIQTALEEVQFSSGANLGIDTTDATAGPFTYPYIIADPPGVSLGLVKLGINTLTLEAQNIYSGGTEIADGTLQLSKDPTLQTGALLGPGPLTIDLNGTLDMNGCPLTLDSLQDGAMGGGQIEDTSSVATGGTLGVTVLTIANSALDTFNGSISDTGVQNEGRIRLVKTGPGTLMLDNENIYTGGTELDQGSIVLGNSYALGKEDLPGSGLTVNGGVLDLNGNDLIVDSLNGVGGLITDNGNASLNNITVASGSGRQLDTFAGSISQSTEVTTPIRLVLLDDFMTLTGSIDCDGGTNVEAGSQLQIGNDYTNGSLRGPVQVDDRDGLIFDVASGSVAYAGNISAVDGDDGHGSVLKTGGGELTLSGDNSYTGATRVDDGTLYLGNGAALPAGTPLIVDNGAVVDLGGNSITGADALQSVTLNNGSIQSTNNQAVVAGTLSATDSFNFANGTIYPMVTLDGPASLNKRTDGTVTLEWTSTVGGYSGGTFVEALALCA